MDGKFNFWRTVGCGLVSCLWVDIVNNNRMELYKEFK